MPVLGIDVGTSGAKAVVLDRVGQPRGSGQASYEIIRPRPDWAEQAPAAWRAGAIQAVRQALAEAREVSIEAIGLSGQMHGVVLLDSAFEPLGNAIIWADGRSAAEAQAIEQRLDQRQIIERAGTRLAPGFMAATVAWLQRHEPDRWAATHALAAPKDWLRWWLTGNWVTEPSEAAGTGLCSLHTADWSADLLTAARVSRNRLPPIMPSAAVTGHLRRAAASALGVSAGLPVVAGCADTAGMALATGVVEPGDGLVAISTGGQALVALDRPAVDDQGRLHTFHHAVPGRWYLMGATLAAGLALRWAGAALLGTQDFAALMALAARAPAGAGGLIFQPYLLGERTPHLDPLARGALVGLSATHERHHIARAVLEGIAFSLRSALDAVAEVAGQPTRIAIAGGGLQHPFWQQIVADALAQPLWAVSRHDLAATGAARLAGVATGYWAAPAAPWPDGEPAARPGTASPALQAVYTRFRMLSPRLHDPAGGG